MGESLKSSEVAIIASSLPSQPTTPVKVSADETPQITIQWTAPAFNGGSSIQNYYIYMNNTQVGTVAGSTY